MAIYSGFTHWKWWFSIVMLNYQRVLPYLDHIGGGWHEVYHGLPQKSWGDDWNHGLSFQIGIWLVVTGTMDFCDFPYIGNFTIPTDELIFFRGVETTNQEWLKAKSSRKFPLQLAILGRATVNSTRLRDGDDEGAIGTRFFLIFFSLPRLVTDGPILWNWDHQIHPAAPTFDSVVDLNDIQWCWMVYRSIMVFVMLLKHYFYVWQVEIAMGDHMFDSLQASEATTMMSRPRSLYQSTGIRPLNCVSRWMTFKSAFLLT